MLIGEYSVMDWVTLGGVLTSVSTILVTFVALARDNKSLRDNIDNLEKLLSEKLTNNHQSLLREYQSLSKENKSLDDNDKAIKLDTGYIRDEMLAEKMARLKLYDNVSNADEILEKLDFLRELVNQNHELTNKVSTLEAEKDVLEKSQSDEVPKLISQISRFSNQLAGLEEYAEAEEIRQVLKKMLNELSDN